MSRKEQPNLAVSQLRGSKSESFCSKREKARLFPLFFLSDVDLDNHGAGTFEQDNMMTGDLNLFEAETLGCGVQSNLEPETKDSLKATSDMASEHDAVTEEMHASANSSEYLACMNTNSNGRVSSGIAMGALATDAERSNHPTTRTSSTSVGVTAKTSAKGGSGELTDSGHVTRSPRGQSALNSGPKRMRRVKTITMGEIPLRPVGLSLSGSGMELYVKVDGSRHKEQLTSLESQFVAQVWKPKKTIRRAGRRKKDDAKQKAMDAPPSIKKPKAGSSARPDELQPVLNNQAKHNAVELLQKNNEAGASSKDSGLESTCAVQASDSDVFIKEEVLQFGKEPVGLMRMPQDGQCVESLQIDPPAPRLGKTFGTHAERFTASERQLGESQKDVGSHRAEVRLANKTCWQRPEGIRSPLPKTPRTTDLIFTKPDAVVSKVCISKKRPGFPPVFTSSDLPLKRPSVVASCSSGDILLHQQRNNSSSFFSPVHLAGSAGSSRGLCSTNNATSTTIAAGSFTAPGSHMKVSSLSGHTGEQPISLDNSEKRVPSTYALMETDSSGSNHHPEPSPSREVDGPSTFPNTDLPSLSRYGEGADRRMTDNTTPLSFADFDPSHILASGVVDAATLAKFAEYTSSMRRDLKQNYKRLSALMKNFNAEVMEHYREQVNLDSGSDAENTDQDGGRGRRCIIM